MRTQQLVDVRRYVISGLCVIRGQPVLGRILAAGVCYGLFSEAWDRLWQTHLLQTIGLPQWLSLIAMVEMGLGIVAGEVVRRRLNLHSGSAMRRVV
jgi:DHA3 family tetracycline resistance protein-like MFS transporter